MFRFFKKKNSSAIAALSKILSTSELETLTKKLSDRRLLYEITTKDDKESEKLAQKVAKILKIKYTNDFKIFNLRYLGQQLPVNKLKELGVFPIVKNNRINALACTDPEIVKTAFSIPKSFPFYIATWSNINKAWKQVEVAPTKEELNLKELKIFLRQVAEISKNLGAEEFNLHCEEKCTYTINVNSKIYQGLASKIFYEYLVAYLSDNKFQLKFRKSYLNLTIFYEIKENRVRVKFSRASKKKISKNKYNIILIDDDKVFSTVLKRFLDRECYNLIEFNSAQNALENIKRKQLNIHLIISDLHMPDASGKEVIRSVRNNVNYNKLPIIVLTSDSNVEVKLELIAHGADAFINKSEDPRLITTHIQSLLKKFYGDSKCIQVH